MLQNQINFLEQVLQITSKSRGVDIGCGLGKHLNELQKISPEVFGVDILPNSELKNYLQLDFFKDKIDLKDLDFAYCIAPYFAQNWWDRLDYFLENVSNCLVANGLFLFDLFNFNSYKVGQTVERISPDNRFKDILIKEVHRFSGKRYNLTNSQSEAIDLLWRVFDKEEIRQVFTRHNLEFVRGFGGFDSSKEANWSPNKQAERILVLFKKVN